MSKRVLHQPIAAWNAGDTVEAFVLVRRKELREDRNGKSYLDLEVADNSASMSAKAWSDSPALEADFEATDFVHLVGSVKLYRDALQLSIDRCRRATDADRERGFDPALLVPSTPEDIDDLWRRLQAILPGEIEHPDLARLAATALATHGEALREHPAAKMIHHAYRGGLLEHVVSMLELARLVTGHYPFLDRDLLLVGILFHDLGKIRELGAMPANDYTDVGRLVGHVVLGRDMLRDEIARLDDFPADKALALEHLVLSHQGRRDYGSPVEPMTAEAVALHAIDDLDAKLNQITSARRGAQGMQFLRGFGRYLYLDGPLDEEEAVAEGEGAELPPRTATAHTTTTEPAATQPPTAPPGTPQSELFSKAPALPED